MSRRGRVISPEIRRSKHFAELSYQCRDLYQGLIERSVDDQGRCIADPAIIRAEVWPWDDVSFSDVDQAIAALADGDAPFIVLYEVNGTRYLQIVNWWRWQKPSMQWASPSNYPAPEGWTDRVRVQTSGNKTMLLNWDSEGGFCSTAQKTTGSSGTWVPAEEDSGVDTGVSTQAGSAVERDSDRIVTGQDRTGQESILAAPQLESSTPEKSAWDYALGQLQQGSVSRAVFETWVHPLRVIGLREHEFEVEAANLYAAKVLREKHILPLLEGHLRAYLQDELVTIRIVVIGPSDAVPKESVRDFDLIR